MFLVEGAVKAEVVFFVSSNAMKAEAVFFMSSGVRWYFGLLVGAFFYKEC